jgi:hypothetical protein
MMTRHTWNNGYAKNEIEPGSSMISDLVDGFPMMTKAQNTFQLHREERELKGNRSRAGSSDYSSSHSSSIIQIRQRVSSTHNYCSCRYAIATNWVKKWKIRKLRLQGDKDEHFTVRLL